MDPCDRVNFSSTLVNYGIALFSFQQAQFGSWLHFCL
jgi:hypothetical protein